MPKLIVFNTITVDGYFTDKNNDMSWAHQGDPDPEFDEFVAGNASGGGVLVFGRKTYELMASFWPTPAAAEQLPVVAREMNSRQKVVFSRTLEEASWSNTRLVKSDLVAEVRRMKSEPGEGLAILGSGSLVAQLASAGSDRRVPDGGVPPRPRGGANDVRRDEGEAASAADEVAGLPERTGVSGLRAGGLKAALVQPILLSKR